MSFYAENMPRREGEREMADQTKYECDSSDDGRHELCLGDACEHDDHPHCKWCCEDMPDTTKEPHNG